MSFLAIRYLIDAFADLLFIVVADLENRIDNNPTDVFNGQKRVRVNYSECW